MIGLLLRLVESSDPDRLRRALHWLYGFVRPQRGAILGLLGLSLCASLLVLAQPWLTKMLIDDGLLAGDFPALVKIAVAMIPGAESGITIKRNAWNRVAPSMRAACSS